MKFILIVAASVAAILLNSKCGLAQSSYQKVAFDAHNTYRAKHNAPPLISDSALDAAALKCAEYYAKKKKIDHTCPYKNGAGENLVGGEGVFAPLDLATMGSKMWYDEISAYNYKAPGFSMATGHFTQVVWKSSKRFGFGAITIDNFSAGVGLYDPPGNYEGQYPQNVSPLL